MTDLADLPELDPALDLAAVNPFVSEPPDFEKHLERLRPELTRYCYQLLGSVFDAEDAVQETFVRAWRGIDRFEGRSALRSWLYTIASNVCLTELQRAKRRALPMDIAASSPGSAQIGVPLGREIWVEPIPDDRVLTPTADPAEIAVARESVTLAFLVALQQLSPRQRAVLLLRDVLRWHAAEVADLLDTTTDSVNALLRRARATLATRSEAARPVDSTADKALLARYVDAFRRFDIDAFVALLHEDATLSMPPYDLWLQGPVAIGEWFRKEGSRCFDTRFAAIAVNGSTGFALLRPDGAGEGRLTTFGIQIVETSRGRISALHTFLDPALFPFFGVQRFEH